MPSPSDGGLNRDWRLYAQDMDRFAHRAVSDCEGLDRERFDADQRVQVELPLLIRQLKTVLDWTPT